MIEIRRIQADRKADANIPNQPFVLWGRLVPSLQEGKWGYRTETFPERTEMCFPDFPYDPETDVGSFFGAYEGETCIGLAVLRREMFRYLYLDDLKVHRAWRGRGVGKLLLAACMDAAEAGHMQGVYTIGQDNNLSACLFYLRNGFEIGGFDNRVYRGTAQEEKANILFYRDCEPVRREISTEQRSAP